VLLGAFSCFEVPVQGLLTAGKQEMPSGFQRPA